MKKEQTVEHHKTQGTDQLHVPKATFLSSTVSENTGQGISEPVPNRPLLAEMRNGNDVQGSLKHVPNVPLLKQMEQRPIVFCDWITIHQDHREALPVLNKGQVVSFQSDALERYQRIDPETGELVHVVTFNPAKADYTVNKAIQHVGSFETNVQISCDGHRVKFSGNAGRFGRKDNAWGYGVVDCISRANEILEVLGLPPFTHLADRVPMANKTETFNNPADNATITRIDLTQNYSTGSKQKAMRFIQSMAGQGTKGRGKAKQQPRAYSNGVTWNEGSKRHYSKLYFKADDLGKYAGEELKEHMENKGVVRHEVSLKSRELSDLDLQTIISWARDTEMENIVYGKFKEVIERNSVSTLEVADIPGKAGDIAQLYIHGANPMAKMEKRTAQRWRKKLLQYGIDIAMPCNIQHISPRIEVIELTPAAPPDWYQYEELQN